MLVKLKISAVFLLVYALPLKLFGQSQTEVIYQRFNSYLEHLRNKEYSELLVYLPQGVLQNYSNEEIIKELKLAHSSKNYDIQLIADQLSSINNPIEYEGQKLIGIHFTNKSRITILKSKDRDKPSIYETKYLLEKIYNVEGVRYDFLSQTYELDTQKRAFAIFEQDEWKFVIVDPLMILF